MTASEAEPKKARMFVALDMPDDVRQRLGDWGRRELTDPALRPVPAANLHLTLCFLGWMAETQRDRIERIVLGLKPRPVAMTFADEPAGKPPRRPGFFALDVDSPAAVEVQHELQEALVAAGLYEPEKRPFWPHLTVARVKTKRGSRRPLAVKRRPGRLPGDLVHTFGSVRVALYRSNLRPEGAQYVSLASMDLPPLAQPGAGKR
jgi:RNA 2',3'-cyclic 3'-phosphodiesterase